LCTDQSSNFGVDHSYGGAPKDRSLKEHGQGPAKHARQGGRGVLSIREKGEEASDLDDPNSKDKPKEVVSKPHSSYQ